MLRQVLKNMIAILFYPKKIKPGACTSHRLMKTEIKLSDVQKSKRTYNKFII